MTKTIGELAEKKATLQKMKSEIDAVYKDKAGLIGKQLAVIDESIMQIFNETGQTSAKTAYGTVYRETLTQINVDNADAFFNWVLETGHVDALQKRVSSTVIKQLLDDGENVQGINSTQIFKIKLRSK